MLKARDLLVKTRTEMINSIRGMAKVMGIGLSAELLHSHGAKQRKLGDGLARVGAPQWDSFRQACSANLQGALTSAREKLSSYRL